MKYSDALRQAIELVNEVTKSGGIPVGFELRFKAVREVTERLMHEAQKEYEAARLLDAISPVEVSTYLADVIRSGSNSDVDVVPLPTLEQMADWVLDGEENIVYQGREDAVRLADRLLGKLQGK